MFFKTKKQDSENHERVHERIDFYMSSYFLSGKDPKNNSTKECWFNNISLGGISIDTKNNELKVDDEINVLYKIESKIRKDICRVRHAKQVFQNWRYGCQFAEPDSQRAELIVSYISKKMLNKE